MFPLLGGVPTEAATAAINGQALLINQTQDRAIVKVAEWFGAGYFRDEYGHWDYWYGAHNPCPRDTHYEPWIRHTGGHCVLNYRY
jgi:hypothetical protein